MKKPRFRWKFSRSRRKNLIPAIFQVDPVRFWPDLAKPHWIQWDFRRIWRNLIDSDEIFVGFGFFSLFSHSFVTVFSYQWRRPIRLPPVEGLVCLTCLLWRLVAGEILLHSILSGQFRVGHKPDPNWPMDTSNVLTNLMDKTLLDQ